MNKLHFLLFTIVSLLGIQYAEAAHINPGQGQLWWGYYVDDGMTGDLGTETTGSYHCAIRIPADHEIAAGATLYAERIWLSYEANVANMRIWMSKRLPASAEEADILCDAVQVNKGGCVDFAFSQPYTMGADSIYVGYSFDITTIESDADRWPVVTSLGMGDIPYAMYVKAPGYTYWMSNQKSLADHGNLAMQVLLGDHFLNNALKLEAVTNVTAARGGEAQSVVTLRNAGGAMVECFQFTTVVDGVESEPTFVDIISSPLAQIDAIQRFALPVPASAVVGRSEAKIRITEVNFEPNEIVDGSEEASLVLTTVAQPSPRKTVMENYVKTTDNLSPLSLVGNDRLTEWHPDEYIGVMIHDQDVMATNLYLSTCVTLTNPWIWANINREGWTYQYYGSQYFTDQQRTKFGIEDDFQAYQQEVVEAGVELYAYWTDEDRTLLKSVARTTFQFSDEDADYALGYLLTEDGMHGEGEAWMQANILWMTQEGHMFDWDEEITERYVYGPELVDNMIYNDVLVAGEGIEMGLQGSISAPIECGVSQRYEHLMSIAGNTMIQDRDSLELTVLLIDTKSGRIVNANRCEIMPYGSEQGIDMVADLQRTAVAYYSLDGKLLAKPGRQPVVVRYADGTVGKRMLK